MRVHILRVEGDFVAGREFWWLGQPLRIPGSLHKKKNCENIVSTNCTVVAQTIVSEALRNCNRLTAHCVRRRTFKMPGKVKAYELQSKYLHSTLWMNYGAWC